jgi:hypothetical protein
MTRKAQSGNAVFYSSLRVFPPRLNQPFFTGSFTTSLQSALHRRLAATGLDFPMNLLPGN